MNKDKFKEVSYNLVSSYDKKLGRIITQDRYTRRRISQKEKGYKLVYTDNLKQLFLAFTTPLECAITMDILSELTNSYRLDLNYTRLIEEYGLSKYQASKLISTLKKENVLKGGRGKYVVNPFYIVPSRMDDEEVTKSQARWRGEYFWEIQ